MITSVDTTAQRRALLAVGGRVDSLSKRKKPKARKLPKNAPRTHRQVHAVLGGVSTSLLDYPQNTVIRRDVM